MKRNRECVICSHLGDNNYSKDSLEVMSLFSEYGHEHKFLFCKNHSIELFKLGQKKFLLNYMNILADVMETNNPEFLTLLEQYVKRYYHEVH